jgi:hypothetical protein
VSRRVSRPRGGAPARGLDAGDGAPRSRWPLVIASVLAVVAITWLALRLRPRSRAAGGNAPPARAATMSPETAYLTALRFSKAGRHEESLPYYRQAVKGSPGDAWMAHYNFGGALYNVGLEVQERHGIPVPVVRSSIERVALMRESLAELETAERLALTPRDRATVLRARGERFQVWGFPWEGFVLLRRAQWTDTTRPELERIADSYGAALEHPERGGIADADSTRRH